MRDRRRTGIAAGVLAPIVLLLVSIALTVGEWSFIRSAGWSAVHRSAVEWPSLLALGPAGWVLVAAFLVVGSMGLAFAVALNELLPRRARAAAWLVGGLSAAVMLEAFRPDSPAAPAADSWHDSIHNAVYPVIPIGAIGSASVLALTLRAADGWPSVARVSRWSLPIMIGGLALTLEGAIAQAGRYVFFAGLFVWIEYLAVAAWRASRSG